MARKNILNPNAGTPPAPASSKAPPPKRGAVGALQSSLTKLQENAVQEIDPSKINNAGVEDRIGTDLKALEQLKTSLATYGQQVPVLVRPHPTHPGRYEIVYGRRRLEALRQLKQPVKAMVRQLDDQALVLAQGQENTARQDLSFVEKASFAAQLAAADYDRDTIAAALNTDQPMLSRMLKVGQAIPLDRLKMIGPAHGIGRDRWLEFVRVSEAPGAMGRVLSFLRHPDTGPLPSDKRFEGALAAAKGKPKKTADKKTPAPVRRIKAASGVVADVKTTRKGVTMTVPTQGGFADWLAENAETVMTDLHARWQSATAEDQNEQ